MNKIEFLKNINILYLTLISGFFTMFLTSAGSAVVFLKNKPTRKFVDISLGFSAGVMLSVSIWSLLLPSIEMTKSSSLPKWFAPTVGFVIGSLLIYILDNYLPHLHIFEPIENQEGIKSNLKKPTLLFVAMTIHNFPEGLAVGVTLGAGKIIEGIILALAIGIQNFPEGMAISLPLYSDGINKFKSFYYGSISAIVEPFGVLLGMLLVRTWKNILPYFLSFAAGAMVYVVVEELIPESQKDKNTNLATFSLMIGFILMMILDLSF